MRAGLTVLIWLGVAVLGMLALVMALPFLGLFVGFVALPLGIPELAVVLFPFLVIGAVILGVRVLRRRRSQKRP